MKTLKTLTLKDNSPATIIVVKGPDISWADKISDLLGHKPPIYSAANQQFLAEDVGLDIYFYLLVQNDVPIANIKTMELQGVGILGDVYTRPEYRGNGVATSLMAALMEDFDARGGRALYLGTGYDSPAYHIYYKFGFRSVEEESGLMAYFNEDDFPEKYFSTGETSLHPLDWRHYPTSAALFMAQLPGVVRCLPQGLLGQSNSEGSMLKVLEEMQKESPSCGGFALQKSNGAVVGMAMWKKHDIWPETALVDVWCHPHFWAEANDLLKVTLQQALYSKCLAYNDSSCPDKAKVLLAAGFNQVAILPEWLEVEDDCVDVQEFIKR